MGKLVVTGWVIPICKKKKWTVAPKIYRTRGFAKSGAKYFERDRDVTRHLDPMPISGEFEIPDNCDECPHRFKCFTER